MLLHRRRNPLHTLTREQHPPRLTPKAVVREASTSLGLALDIDEIVASPWIGLHYRHEFLLHHRHELLEPAPDKRAGVSRIDNSGGCIRTPEALGRIRQKGQNTLGFDAKPAQVGSLLAIEAGDLICVTDFGGTYSYEGTVEVTAPHLNVLWIRTKGGHRKLIDAKDCTIQLVARSTGEAHI